MYECYTGEFRKFYARAVQRRASPKTDSVKAFELSHMSSGEDFLFRPVVKGLLHIKDLKSGEVDLNDVADLNEALDVMEENERRAMA